jgi:dihydrofolate reductase
MCSSIEEAVALCKDEPEIFFIGGGSVYKEVIDVADKLYLTRIHHRFEDADTFFPLVDPQLWVEVSKEDHPMDEKHKYAYSFITFEKIKR